MPLLRFGQKSAQEKVASFLHLLARRAEQAGCTHLREFGDHRRVTFTLPLTRSEIGDFLGLTIETVSRQMTKLKGLGVIELDGLRSIIVPDMERLGALTES